MKLEKVNKILVIKLRGIGDVVLSTIVIDNLLAEFPGAEIDFLTEKPSFNAISDLPQINRVLIFKKSSLWDKIKFFLKIRRQKYDLILDLFSSPFTAQITYLSGARYRIGFPYKGRKYAYNIFGPPERDKFHNAELHLRMLADAGIYHSAEKLYFNIDNDALSFAKQYLNYNHLTENLTITLSPSGGWQSKRIEPEKFAEFGDYLADKLDCKILIVWGPDDKPDAEKIAGLMKNKPYLAPPTSLLQMGAFLKLSDIVIANCSGPMHISTAVGTPTLSIHGPTIPYLQGAYGEMHETLRLEELDCIGCNLLNCPKEHECFKNLPPESVYDKVITLLAKNNVAYNEKN